MRVDLIHPVNDDRSGSCILHWQPTFKRLQPRNTINEAPNEDLLPHRCSYSDDRKSNWISIHIGGAQWISSHLCCNVGITWGNSACVRVSELSRWSWGKGRWSVLEGRHGCTWVSAGECLKRNQEESEILKLKLQIQSNYNAHGIRLNKACMQPITAVYTLQNINRVSPLLLRRESSILRKT